MSASKSKKKMNSFLKNLLISCVIFGIILALMTIYLRFKPETVMEKHNWFDVEMVRELTTVEAKHHVVAVHEEEGNFLGVGRKYVWYEYDVIVEAGVDVEKVKIQEPTADGVIKIYLPPAEIFRINEEKETISNPVKDLGFMTELTTEEANNIINNAKEKLKNDTQLQEVLQEARSSAKNVLENYVISVGKMIGETYTVEWVENSEDIPVTSTNEPITSITK